MLTISDEITESEDKSGNSLKVKSNKEEEKSNYESETESEQGSHRPDFLEKLDDLIQKFKNTTDGTVKNMREMYISEEANIRKTNLKSAANDENGK